MNYTTLALFLLLSSFAHANVIGSAQQNFNPTTDGLDFVTVQSTQTLKPGIFNLGAFLNYAVNTLPYLDSSTQSRVRINDSVLAADLNIGLGLTSRLDVGVSFPMILRQSVGDQGSIHGQFTANGNTEIRPNAKYRIFGGDLGGLAAIASMNFDRIANDPYTGNNAGPTFNAELAADTTINHYRLALNVGRRFRASGSRDPSAPIDPLGDQWIASVAGSYLLSSLDTKLIAEIFASSPVGSQPTNVARNLTSSEALFGAKHDFSNQLAMHAGLGAGLQTGVAAPDWRVYVGLNYTFGPVWQRQTQVEPMPTAAKAPAETNYAVGSILFDFNSANLADNHAETLAPLVEHLRTRKFSLLRIEGYTDSVGRAAYNLDLSQRRAEAVQNYLITQGFAAKKIEAKGFGAERPIADNANYQGRNANRRVEFHISY